MSNSLNEIDLNTTLLHQLYKNSLVLTGSSGTPPARPAPGSGFLGNYTSRIMILVNHPLHPFLPDEELELLTKMLGACQLSLNEAGIFNLHGNTAEALTEVYRPDKQIFFTPDESTWFRQTSTTPPVLYAPPLQHLLSDQPETKTLKTKLWHALRQLFQLS